jgi:multiple sugar transport system ATP-binding protein
MIYVTHDQIEAMTMGDRIVVMNNGKVQQTDTPLKLYNEPDNLFVAGFLGSPPMNFINGELKQERDAVVFKEMQSGTIEVRLKDRPRAREFFGKPMVLGIRPEDIELAQFSNTGNAAANFPAIVDIVEPMGAETNLYLQTGAHTVVCRSQRALDHRETGHRLQFDLNARKAYLFDPATTSRVI